MWDDSRGWRAVRLWESWPTQSYRSPHLPHHIFPLPCLASSWSTSLIPIPGHPCYVLKVKCLLVRVKVGTVPKVFACLKAPPPRHKGSLMGLWPGERPVLSPPLLMTLNVPRAWVQGNILVTEWDWGTNFFICQMVLQMFQYYLVINLLVPHRFEMSPILVLNSQMCLGQFVNPLFRFTNPSVNSCLRPSLAITVVL